MSTHLVLTFIAPDQPGVVETVSGIISDAGGNWLESRLAHLSGRFAGIVRLSINDANAAELKQELRSLADAGMQILIEDEVAKEAGGTLRHLALQFVGNDRPGIVREIAQALASRGINVEEMASNITSAPMTAQPLFEASAAIAVASDTDIDELQDALDTIGNELTLEITLGD